MRVIAVYGLAAATAVAAVLGVAVVLLLMAAICSALQALVLDPWHRYRQQHRDAAAQAAAVAAKIEAEANEAVRRLERAYIDAAERARHAAASEFS